MAYFPYSFWHNSSLGIIPGVLLWAKPESLTGLLGSNISIWTDSSGRNNHITNPNAAEQATLLTNELNGYNAAHFSSDYYGFNNVMYVPAITVGLNYTINIVFKITADFSYHPLLWDSNLVMQFGADSINGGVLCFDSANNGVSTTGFDMAIYTSWTIVVTNGVPIFYRNGTNVSGASSTMTSNQIITTISAKADLGVINGANPDIVEIQVYDHSATAAELSIINAYISTKFGI